MPIKLFVLFIFSLALPPSVCAEDSPVQKNRSVWQIEVLTNFMLYFQDYARNHNGKFPETWVEFERTYDRNRFWASEKIREKTISQFAFTPGLRGDMATKQGLAKDWDLLMIETVVTSRRRDGGGDSGRWGIWRTAGGVMTVEWFSESDLSTFTKWKEVERLIDAANARNPTAQPSQQQKQTQSSPSKIEFPAVGESNPVPVEPNGTNPGRTNIWPYLIFATIIILGLAWHRVAKRRN